MVKFNYNPLESSIILSEVSTFFQRIRKREKCEGKEKEGIGNEKS